MMGGDKRLFLACISALLLSLSAGCKSSSPPKSIVIRSVGDYPSPDGVYIAHITVDSRKLVNYSITRSSGGQILDSGKAGNSFMKFFMCWDQSNNFFIDSEDTSRILIFHQGKFQPTEITPENYATLPQPPAEFANSK